MALLRCGFVDVYQGELVGLRLLPGWDCFQVPYPMGPGDWGVVGVLSCVRWSWMAGLAYPGGVVGVVVGLLGQFVGAIVGGVSNVAHSKGWYLVIVGGVDECELVVGDVVLEWVVCISGGVVQGSSHGVRCWLEVEGQCVVGELAVCGVCVGLIVHVMAVPGTVEGEGR